ncbi:MAG: 50S ribosomal protein L11 methyltransferase [Chloroflexota bacterium]|nr:MAG: 50S ribosomal protein L11 methyltransferase [Chloroflexota bacterium]
MYDRSILDTIEYHHSLLTDEARMRSYLRAIFRTVKPGDVVLDIGSGTGILAYFSCMAGARQVYAVEQDPVVELAKAIRDHNGFQDRVIFLNEWSDEVELPEPVDVVVTETIGNIGFEEGILGWLVDAKERLLAENGRIIPKSVELVLAPVEIPDAFGLLNDWTKQRFTLDLAPARNLVTNNLVWISLQPNMLMGQPDTAILVETSGVTSSDIDGVCRFVANRDGVVSGIGCWFKAELVPGITISNEPTQKGSSWTQILLPLGRPLPVSAGDELHVWLQSSANGAHWQWGAGNGYQAIEKNGQSTLSGRLGGAASQSELEDTPARNADGVVDLFILQMMDGSTTVREMARRTADRFPLRFGSLEQALEHVQLVSYTYGRGKAGG